MKCLHFRAHAAQSRNSCPGCHHPKCQGIPDCDFLYSRHHNSRHEFYPSCNGFIGHDSAYHPEMKHCEEAQFPHQFTCKSACRGTRRVLEPLFSPVNLTSSQQKEGIIHHAVNAVSPFALQRSHQKQHADRYSPQTCLGVNLIMKSSDFRKKSNFRGHTACQQYAETVLSL